MADPTLDITLPEGGAVFFAFPTIITSGAGNTFSSGVSFLKIDDTGNITILDKGGMQAEEISNTEGWL